MIPAARRLREENCLKLKVRLMEIVSSRPARSHSATLTQRQKQWAGETAQLLRTLAALAEDPGLIPSSHM